MAVLRTKPLVQILNCNTLVFFYFSRRSWVSDGISKIIAWNSCLIRPQRLFQVFQVVSASVHGRPGDWLPLNINQKTWIVSSWMSTSNPTQSASTLDSEHLAQLVSYIKQSAGQWIQSLLPILLRILSVAIKKRKKIPCTFGNYFFQKKKNTLKIEVCHCLSCSQPVK